MPARAATIVDIARQAGVSKSLVSLAIRNDPGVSSKTRERILQVADDLGYRSNTWARSLVRGRTQLIGILLTDLRNAYHTDVVTGVEDEAARLGLQALISHGRREPRVLAQRLEAMVELGMEGIVVVSAHVPPGALSDAARHSPVVVVGRPPELPAGISQVHNDDEAGARLAVEHLLGQGHERIAYLQASTSPAALARRDAYRAVLEEHGLGPRVVSHEQLCDVLTTPDRPTAVLASNDRGAATVLGVAHDLGLRVPDDVAVVGYDDTELARLLRPELTSIAQPRTDMGRRALELLRGGEVTHEVHQPWLVPRASSATAGGPGR